MSEPQGAARSEVAEVAGVVVSYNVRDLVVRTVDGMKADGIGHVVVVDNDSSDGSAEAVGAAHPDVELVALTENTGFAGGVNRAVARTSSPYVLVTTPDVIAEPGTTKLLLEALERSPDIGLVGPLVRTPDGRVYPSVRRFPNLRDAVGHAFLHFLWPSNPFSRRYRMLDWDHSSGADVDWVAGTHFLVRRAAWDRVSGFDEGFFMFVEDVDLCWRLHEAGWRVRYEPAAEVVHEVSRSADQVPYRMIVAHHRSLYRFNAKRAHGAKRLLLPVVAAGLGLRTLLAWAQRAWRGKPHAAH